ncbi:MAG: hypothetical protein WBM37_10785 [Nitrososphaeraceae archaeon]
MASYFMASYFMAMARSISCLNCANDIGYNPDELRNKDNPSVKCEKCGETTPLTPDNLE